MTVATMEEARPETWQIGDEPGTLTFAEAVPRFLDYLASYKGCAPGTLEAYGRDLEKFRQFLHRQFNPIPRPAEITRRIVIQYAVSLSDSAPITVRRRIAVLASFYSFLENVGCVSEKPTRRVPLPKLRYLVTTVLSEEEAHRLIAAADTPLMRCLVVLLLSTGIRRSEATQIDLEDLDLDNQQLLIHGKGAKERMVPLNELAVEAIRHLLAHRGNSESRRLFLNQKGIPIRSDTINFLLERLVERAELARTDITPHRLRHTFATHLIRNSVDVKTVQELLGHSDMRTTSRYLHSDTRTKQAAVKTLTGLVQPDR